MIWRIEKLLLILGCRCYQIKLMVSVTSAIRLKNN